VNLHRCLFGFAAGVGLALGTALPAFAQAPVKKPNILVIWGDDIGIHNISAYNLGAPRRRDGCGCHWWRADRE